MKRAFYLNDVKIKTPYEFRSERFKITKAARSTGGLMQQELVAKKLKFYFTYDVIEATDLDTILDIIWESDELFYNLRWIDNNVECAATVYVGAIPQTLFRTGGEWAWKNVTFNLIQQ